MSDVAVKYAEYLIQKYFGDASARVTFLMRTKGRANLLEILKDCLSTLNSRQVCTCLKSLLQHAVVQACPSPNVQYSLNYVAIFNLPRLPIFCELMLHYYGKVAEDIIMLFGLYGRVLFCDLLRRCLTIHLKDKTANEQRAYIESVGSITATLIKTNVLIIVDPTHQMQQSLENSEQPNQSGSTTQLPVFDVSSDELCDLLHNFVSDGSGQWPWESVFSEPERKRLRTSDSFIETKKLLQSVVIPNTSSLEAMWRDRLICQLATEKLGTVCGEIMSHFLCIATASNRSTTIMSLESGTVSRNELIRSFRNVPDHFDSYLTLLTDDEIKFLLQKPGLSGYMYTCPYKHIVKQILIKHIESVVQILYENSGLRIFRLLLTEGPLNLEETERRVLLAQSDFRRILPRMVASGFICTKELSRTKDYTAETIYCLYSINLTQISRLLIELAQHTVLRTSLRRDYEFNEKVRLIEHRHRVECLIQQHEIQLKELQNSDSNAKLSDNESEDVGSLIQHHQESITALKLSITPPELKQLSSLILKTSKLVICERECHVSWFMADLYLRLHP